MSNVTAFVGVSTWTFKIFPTGTSNNRISKLSSHELKRKGLFHITSKVVEITVLQNYNPKLKSRELVMLLTDEQVERQARAGMTGFPLEVERQTYLLLLPSKPLRISEQMLCCCSTALWGRLCVEHLIEQMSLRMWRRQKGKFMPKVITNHRIGIQWKMVKTPLQNIHQYLYFVGLKIAQALF